MSREFGRYQRGYLWEQIEWAAEDCSQGGDELTRLWGLFLEEFAPIAYALCSSECGDHGVDFPIMRNIERMSVLRERLQAIAEYLEPFERVAKEAVYKAVKATE